MTTTTNLSITHLAENQANPETVENEAKDIFDGAVAGLLTHDMASDANYTLATTGTPPYEWQNAVIRITDTETNLTAARDIIVPTNKKIYFFINETAYDLTLKTSAGTGITVRPDLMAFLRCDGTNVVRMANDLIDSALDSQLTHDMGSDADYTLSTSTDPQEWKYEAVKITDTGVVLTTGRNIIVPTNTKKYLFINATAQTLTLKTSGGSGVAVATNKNAICWCDGTDVIRLSQDS